MSRGSIIVFGLSILTMVVALANNSLLLALFGIAVALFAYKSSWRKLLQLIVDKIPKPFMSYVEWGMALFLAVLILQNIFFFFFELYTIPSSSMEPNLRKGDMVIVNKTLMGNRMFPGFMSTSFRLGGIGEVERGDAIVFNFPEGDSVYVELNRDNYLYLNRLGNSSELQKYQKRYQPINKRSRYLKRVIALPSDTFSLRNGSIYVNGKVLELKLKTIRRYELDSIKNADLIEKLSSSIALRESGKVYVDLPNYFDFKTLGYDAIIEPFVTNAAIPDRLVFPFTNTMYYFNSDNIGSIVVPKKGMTVELSSYTIPFYRRIISIYEGNKLEEKGSKFYMNGKEVKGYTFKQNYYWVMGDNREHSYDSRYFGFVPENHVIGIATRILLSKDYDKGFYTIPQFNRFMLPL